LRRQKVLAVTKVPVVDAGRHFWSLCIECLSLLAGDAAGSPRSLGDAQRPRVGYCKILSPDAFDRYGFRDVLAPAIA
jgi:hypothetical protein